MAHTRPYPIWMATLTRDGAERSVPLLLPAPFGVGRSAVAVKSDLGAAIDASWMVSGDTHALVGAGQRLHFETERLELLFPATTDHDALALELSAAVGRAPAGGWLAFSPALDVGAHGRSREDALAALKSAVTAWFVRGDRRADPRGVAETQWWTGLTVESFDHELTWLTFNERRAIDERRARDRGRRIEACARPLPAAAAFELEEARTELRRALAQGSRCVLVVGPSGAGKTTLIADEAHGGAFGSDVWTTTAARLVNALTREDSWQDALAALCSELARDVTWLHVASLADLFEVGRYHGNEVSLGEYLRPWLSRGDFGLVAECTSEQRAALEARYPGIVELFTKVELPALDEPRLERVVAKFARARGPETFEPGATDEAIRLLRRFAPYSGYPGRVLRFLDGLLRDLRPPVFRSDVIGRFVTESGVPRSLVDRDVPVPWAEVEARLSGALFGQPLAVQALLDVVTAVKADVAPRGRPVASLLFTGPTGVGKTEAARVLAGELFGDRTRFVRFDMSEFATGAAVLRLVRSPDPLGEGLLTGAVRRQPFAVILLDEIEKAHPDLFDLLLQVLGEGRLTDARGKVVDFCSTVVVMTSNLGADLALRARTGFSRGPDTLAGELTAAVHKAFRPELTNRIDRIVPFAPLGRDAVLRVLDRELAALARHPALVDRGLSVEVTASARDWLADRGTDPARGARPLQRTLQQQVLGPIARSLNAAPSDARGFRIDATEGLTVTRLAKGVLPAVPADPSGLRIQSLRRRTQQSLAGECFASWAATCRESERRAELEARHGRFEALDHRARDPLNALEALLEDALRIESLAVAAAAGLAPAPTDVAGFEARLRDATLELYDAVHPHARVGFVGIWAPADAPAPAILERARATEALAERVGLRWTGRAAWWMPGDQVETVGLTAKAPHGALRWLGAEVWLEGPAAALLLADWHGLWTLPRGQGSERARGVSASPLAREIPSCCDVHAAHQTLARVAKPATGALWDRFTPPRPSDLIRKSAYQGDATAWTAPEDTDRFHNRVAWHVAQR